MDIAELMNGLVSAVADAKQKADLVASYRADLAATVTQKQAQIDVAQSAYDDAKVAVDRLWAQAREEMGALLPVQDTRFRASK